jgi:autotransporter-associated beta strand protein
MKKIIQLVTRTGRLVSTFCLLSGALVLLSPTAARAVNGTWLTTTGNWSDSNLWANNVIADGPGGIVGYLRVNGDRTLTVNSSRTNGGFTSADPGFSGLNNKKVIIASSGGSTLTLAGATPSAIPVVVALNGTLEFHVVLDGTAGVRFVGQNSGGFPPIYLYATNIYSGNTEIAAEGPVRIGVGVVDAIPHGPGKGNVVLVNSSHGYGNLDIRESDITINGLSGAGGTVSASVSISPGTSTLTVGDADATATFSGIILDSSRTVALTKIGTGTQTLNGTNLYTGATTVDGGTLAVNGSIDSAVTVNNTGTLGGTGTVNGSVIVTAGGNIGPGTSAGILTLGGGLDMSAPNTTYTWELAANSTTTPGTDFDQIALTGGSTDVTDANLNIQFTGAATTPDGNGFWANNHSWLIVSGTVAGNFKNIQNGTNAAGYFYTTVDGSGVTLNFVKTGVVSPQPRITSIPGAGTALVTVNYTNTVPTKTYFLRYKTTINGVWATNLPGKIAVGNSDSQTDIPLAGSQRYYQVYYQP